MISIVFILLFIGIIMVVDGIYREEIEHLKNNKQIEYKFIPRAMYQDMLYGNHEATPAYARMFDEEQDPRGAGRYL